MSRIFVTGDIHSEVCDRFSSFNFPEGKKLTRDDYVFIAGDFGVIWDNDETNPSENYLLDWLDEKPWTTFVIGGNHENWDRLRKIPLEVKFGVKLGVIRPNVLFVPNGTLITLNGKKIFCFGGAMSTDKVYRTEGISWWAGEIPPYEEMNLGTIVLENNGYKVDIIITHTMPIDCVEEFVKQMGYNSERIVDPVSNYLSFIQNHTQFDKWFCGHFHKDHKFGKVDCLYNTIIDVDTGTNHFRGFAPSWS